MASIDELFQKRVPVVLKSQDREERKTNIKVAVEIHTTANPVHRKDLVLTLTDESDLFFLYTLKLTEEDFQSLKTQQGLLVDFGAFPQKFIQLLELCIQEEHKESPKFILHLISNGTTGMSTANLNVIETNPFKHLTHLALKLLPGTDGDVKKYLAHCLKTLKDQNQLLLERLEHTEGDLSQQLRQAREALSKRTQELDSLKAEWTTRTSDLMAKHSREMTAEKERYLQGQTEAQQMYDREKREAAQAHQNLVKDMDAKSHQLDLANKDLTDKKYKAEATIRELRSRQNLLEEENNRTKQELQNIRKENAALDHDYHEQEKDLNQTKTKLAVLEQEVKDKGDVVKRTSDLLGTEQDQKKKHEEELEKKKRHISKLESTVKTLSEEVIKGNEIIKKLQGDMKHYSAKLKLRTQVTTEQEKLLVEKNREMEDIRKQLESTKSQLQHKEDENKKLDKSLEETMAKLEESKQLLKTNENVINWLNKQITETQLHSHKSHGPFEMTSSSTASFKPHTGMHNFSAPSTSYDAQSVGSRTTRTNISPPSGHTHPKQPMVHYNPNMPRKSALPMPIAKSSPIGVIPEESRPDNLHASPPLHNHLPPPQSQHHLHQQTQKPREPFLDAKYLQQQGDDPPLRSSTTAPRTISPTPYPITSKSQSAPLGANRMVKSQEIRSSNPPLASAYFPGKTKVS